MHLVSSFIRKHQCGDVSLGLAHWYILQKWKVCSIIVAQDALGEVKMYDYPRDY